MEIIILLAAIVIIGMMFKHKIIIKHPQLFSINTLGHAYLKQLDITKTKGVWRSLDETSQLTNEIEKRGYDTGLIITEYGDSKFQQRQPNYNKCKQVKT